MSLTGDTTSYAKVSPQGKALAAACALFLVVAALCIQAGWLTRTPVLLLPVSATGFATFNTATLFLVCGAWLILLLYRVHQSTHIRLALACVVIGLPILTLFEHLSGIDLGISLLGLHYWVEVNNASFGRMAPNTCLAFLVAGVLCFLHDLHAGRHRDAALLTGLRIVLSLLAGISMLGYMLDLEWLYQWFAHNRMGLNTAIGMVVLATGLVIATQPVLRLDEARKINIMTSVLLTMVALVSGLTGFTIFKSGMEQSIANNLNSIADSRSEVLLASIRQGQQASRAIAAGPELQAFLKQRRHGNPNSATLELELRDDAIVFGLASIEVRDTYGIPVFRIGSNDEFEELELPIRGSGIATSLAMGESLLLRNVIRIEHEGKLLGTMVTEQLLPDIERIFRHTEDMGKSGEIKLCGKRGDTLECLPSRMVPNVHRVPFYTNGKPSFPVARAILGESGHLNLFDFRGVGVSAAFRPVGNTGLGLVAKMDSNEIYAPLRTRSVWLLLIPLVLVVFSLYMIRQYLRPITKRLQSSEQAARGYAEDVTMTMLHLEHARQQIENAAAEGELRERLLRSLADALPVMVAFIDRDERYSYCNNAYVRVLGRPMEELVGRTVREVLGEENYRFVKPHLENALNGHTAIFERPMQAKGEMHYVESSYVPRTDIDGNIVGVYATTWDVTQTRQRELRLEDEASKDAMTDLFNRPAITEILETEIEKHYLRRGGLAVFFLDVDKFKQVNDLLGHAAGDQVLITYARRLKGTVRTTDFVARLGGDEFVIVLTSLDSVDVAARVAQKIIDAITYPMEIDGVPYAVSTSIGIAYMKNHKLPAGELLARADAALYEAKRSGRNTFRIEHVRP